MAFKLEEKLLLKRSGGGCGGEEKPMFSSKKEKKDLIVKCLSHKPNFLKKFLLDLHSAHYYV